MQLNLITTIEEQMSVRFTGKVNILSNFNRQYLGHILFKDGDLIQVIFQVHKGLKAFYQVAIQEFTLHSLQYIVEPEVVEDKERQIHFPFGVIKNRLNEVLQQYQASIKLRPPENVKILINSDFISSSRPVSSLEFQVLDTLTEWSAVNDVYQQCELLDHEITNSLVSLRKKGALKIIAPASKSS